MLTAKWVKAVPHTHAVLSHVETETDQSCQGFSGLLSPEKHPRPSVNPVCKQFLLPKGRGSCETSARCPWKNNKAQEPVSMHAWTAPPPTPLCLSKLTERSPSAIHGKRTLYPCCKPGTVSKVWREPPEAAKLEVPSPLGQCLVTNSHCKIKAGDSCGEKASHHGATPTCNPFSKFISPTLACY